MADQTNGNGAGGGVGRPPDALAEFFQVAGGAAKELVTERAGDPRVQAAFSLGWQMAELYRSVTQPSVVLSAGASVNSTSPEPTAKGDLPGISKMTPEQRDLGAASRSRQPSHSWRPP